MIRGACIGGGLEIAARCDLRIAAASARIGAPIRDLGFPMVPEELQALLLVAGRNVTLELLLEGRIFTAHEAAAKGLLTRVVADVDLENELHRSARNIAAGSSQVARINKQTLRRLSPEPTLLAETELRAFYSRWANSTAHREGVQAFLEKRQPKFN
jgi:enoyl-CoA hydratase/carnithine racemase